MRIEKLISSFLLYIHFLHIFLNKVNNTLTLLLGLIVLEKGDKKGPPSVQVIIAALNEEEGIGFTIAELMDTLNCPSVLVVDGRSTDRTVEVAKNMGAEIFVQDGLGKGDALAKAITKMDPSVDYVVITDADYTYPAEYVPEMIRILEKNPDVGMVCGNRFSGYTNFNPLTSVFYIGNRFIAFTHNLLNGIALDDPLTGLRLVRAEILRNWTVKSKGFDVEVELNHHVEREDFSIVEIPIKYRERLGEKKLGVKHGVEILKRIILETTY
jgi:glycosyltransferase involved in cell wall biosynthesis